MSDGLVEYQAMTTLIGASTATTGTRGQCSTPMAMKMRVDEVTDGGDAEAVLANAPLSEDGFYMVPKVIE